MLVLGIETSCDETAAAVVAHTGQASGKVLSNVVATQISKHIPFGGIVPEVAARAHVENLDSVINQALTHANVSLKQLSGIAVTAGPGLVGALTIGLVTAKTIALVTNKPLIDINHLEGHVLTPRLTDGIPFPYISLLISGGHTQFIVVEKLGKYIRLGTTIDDALGEAFDKTARLLGAPYPGGCLIEKYAATGNATRFLFPRALNIQNNFDFSFSGLKTAVRIAVNKIQPLKSQDIQDLSASFQAAVTEIIEIKTCWVLKHFAKQYNLTKPILVPTGGVAANSAIRKSLQKACKSVNAQLVLPPQQLCTDNGAIIAWAGAERLFANLPCAGMTASARSRWPLDNTTPPKIGYGRKGAKA